MRWIDAAIAAGLLGCVALAAGLEGGVEHRMGGPPMLVAALLAAILIARHGLPRPGRLARAGIWLLALPLLYQLAPVPASVRAVIAPGQAEWYDRVGLVPDRHDAWLADLARRDLDAALGVVDAAPDLLSDARDDRTRPAAVDPDALPWEIGSLAAFAVVFIAGMHLGRRERIVLGLAIGMMFLGIAESMVGLLWRNGPTTGIGPKLYYLGSATGTFVNRGHLAAFLILSIGATWGLAASLFPLVPEEVRRHRARKRRSSQPPSVLEAAGDKVPRLLLLGFMAGVLSLGLVATQSRGPILGLVTAAALGGAWTWLRREERMHAAIGLGVPVCGLVLATIALGPRGAVGRFLNLGSDDISYVSRVAMWKESLRALQDAPVFGTGLGGWSTVWPLYEEAPHLYFSRYAHNEYLQWAVELGVPGLVGLVLLVAAFFGLVRRGLDVADQSLRTSVGVGLAVAILAVLLQSVADFPLHTPGVALICSLSAGLVVG
jgi:O-antigen ligase